MNDIKGKCIGSSASQRPKRVPRGVVIVYANGEQLCVRSWPASVANPRTPGQVRARSVFTAVTAMLRSFTPALHLGFAPAWKVNGRKVSPYHCAVSHHLRAGVATVDATGRVAIDFRKVALTQGADDVLGHIHAQLRGQELLVRWMDALPRRAKGVMLAVYSHGAQRGEVWIMVMSRKALTLAVRLEEAMAAGPLEIYLAPWGDGQEYPEVYGWRSEYVHLPLGALEAHSCPCS